MKPSDLLNQANAVLDNGVRTKEAYLTAVPMVCGLREHARLVPLRHRHHDQGEVT